MVRTGLILLSLLIVLPNFSFAQLYKEKEIKVDLLISENEQFLSILDSIIVYEEENCYSYSNDRIYVIEYEAIDSLIAIVTIRSDHLKEILSNPLYGFFEHSTHLFFVRQPFENLFGRTCENRTFNISIVNQRFAKRKKIIVSDFVFDDSLTKWTYILKSDKFIFGSKKGQCKGM